MQRIDLGPIVPGERSVLDFSCTHMTSGLGWPAFDTGWDAYEPVIAPEACYVYDDTSDAQGGDAFYVRGDSGLRYWVAHITTVPALGRRFRRGEVMTRISPEHKTPHVHVAIDARPVLGRHLTSEKWYRLGAPPIGLQFERHFRRLEAQEAGSAKAYWTWVQWRLSEGRFKGRGRAEGAPRPAGLPRRIPRAWWLRLGQFLARRKK